VFTLLAAAYSHAALGQKVVSIITKLEYCGVALGRNDQSLGNKPIKNGPFVSLQIRSRPLKQIAKHRNFEIRQIICHDIASLWSGTEIGVTAAKR
jgi:hypothetical protein